MSSESNFPFNQATVWQPNPDWLAASNLQAFMTRHGIGSYPELLTRANADIAWFWDAVMADLDIQFARPYTTVFAAYNHYAGPKDIRIWPYNQHEGGQSYQAVEQMRFLAQG